MRRPTSGPDEAIRLSLWVFGGVVAFLALVLTAVWWTKPAKAHGAEWEWIMSEPKYKAADGQHCCSYDCAPDVAGKFREDRDGIAYEGQKVYRDRPGIYSSNEPNPPGGDQRWWRCKLHGQLRCVFRPFPGGS